MRPLIYSWMLTTNTCFHTLGSLISFMTSKRHVSPLRLPSGPPNKLAKYVASLLWQSQKNIYLLFTLVRLGLSKSVWMQQMWWERRHCNYGWYHDEIQKIPPPNIHCPSLPVWSPRIPCKTEYFWPMPQPERNCVHILGFRAADTETVKSCLPWT